MDARDMAGKVALAAARAGLEVAERGIRVAQTVVSGIDHGGHPRRIPPGPDGDRCSVELPDGVTVEVREAGEGPTVLLLHGYGLGASSWNPVAAALVERGHHVVSFDWRGHGTTPSGEGTVTTRQLVDDLVAVVEALELQDAVLVGHSTGGYVALTALVDEPAIQQRLTGLVLVSTLAGQLLDHDPDEDADGDPLEDSVSARLGRNGTLRLLLSGFVPRVGVTPAISSELLDEFAAADHDALASLVRELAEANRYGELGGIELPAVVLCGQDDHTTPAAHGQAIADELQDARFEEVRGAGHLLNWQHPGRIVDAISTLTAAARSDHDPAAVRHAVLVLNPASGDHDADHTEATIVDRLTVAGYETEVRRTEGEGDARAWACEVARDGDTDLVVAAGGDGTVREVVSGLLDAGDDADDVTLGVVPMGTANLFARAFGVPQDDPTAAAAVAAGDRRRDVDVVHLVDRDEHGILMVDAGFDARLVRDASRGLKDVLGSFAYVAAGLRHTVGLRDSALTIEIDDETIEVEGHSVLCLNVGRIGEAVVVDEDIAPDDGLLHVGVVQRARPWSVLWAAAGLVVAGRDAHPNIEWRSGQRVRVDADPSLSLQLDGDPIGELPVELELLPGAITVAVPDEMPDD